MHDYLARIDGLALDALGEYEGSKKTPADRDTLIDRLGMCQNMRRMVEQFENKLNLESQRMFAPRHIRTA